ncbi:MAG TPA: metabolite traffic protein EboE [Verrucomicrobiae bacterium]|jgi:sugar phosphate isomerase/epimerase|nr:metabolite traffic protein EboE [Verrucomicrobiae bacterium]
MLLAKGHHLAYCGNIHRGETWPETFAALEQYTLAVKQRVSPSDPYGIGLRLSDQASRELSAPPALADFQRWLERHDCYVFTINGFPYGKFHGQRVKEQVYAPDWTTSERLEYTNRLFDLLAQLLPRGVEGSVSTLPCSFKAFIKTPEQERQIRSNIWHCVEHIAALAEKSGRVLHLGLEPEPLCFLETTDETVAFFGLLRDEHGGDARIASFLGVNYDTCHLAVEYEDSRESLSKLRRHGIKISKIHLSSALKMRPSPHARTAVAAFADNVYLHQVVARDVKGRVTRFRDLDAALRSADPAEEWRVHFHIPLQCGPADWFDTTADHLLGALDVLSADPGLCSHLEMETYTWEVLPPELKSRSVVDQLAAEYEWCLAELRTRGLGRQ